MIQHPETLFCTSRYQNAKFLSPDNQMFLIIKFAISLFMSNKFIQIPNMLSHKLYIINILTRTGAVDSMENKS